MKKSKRIIRLISIFTATAACAFLFASCSKSPDLEDILPDKFGEPEGFYIYKGNTRSLTDGTNKESLLKTVTVDGKDYGESNSADFGKEQFYVSDYAYAAGVHKAFFYVSLKGNRCLYEYDYEAKSSKALYTAEYFKFYKSETYIYVKNEDTESASLYSLADGEFVCDFYGDLNGDVVYNYDKVYDYGQGVWHDRLTWIKDGKTLQAVYGENRFDDRYFYRFDDYFCFLTDKIGVTSCAVNLNDGSVSDLSYEESEAYRNKIQNRTEQTGQQYTMEINGYRFYVDSKTYNEYQYPGYLPIPIPNDEKCWFMYRVHGGKTEVMQYSTESGKFYDDIREF